MGAEPRRILIIRTSALGDIVHCLPALSALRRRHPGAHIAWLVEEAFAPLLDGHADLDEVIPIATRRWRRAPAAAPREIAALAARLRRFAPDATLDLMGNHKAGILSRLAGGRRRLGARRADRREPSSALWIGEPVAVAGVHAVDRALSLAAALGGAPAPADFAPQSLLPAVGPAGGVPPLLVVPGGGWGNKRYPPGRWVEVVRGLAAASGLAPGVVSGPDDEAAAAAIAAASGAATVPAVGLPALVAVLRAARLVLGGDSGPLHLAHALGRPVVCVMGPTDPARHGPYGAPQRAVVHPLPCSFCYRRFDAAKACLLDIPPAEIVARARTVLAA